MRLTEGQKYTVKVKEIVSAGAVVILEDGSTQLVHISNISNMYVRDVGNFVEEGQELVAEAVAGKAHPVELSFKHLDLHPAKRARSYDNPDRGYNPYTYDEDEDDRANRRTHSPKPKNKKRKHPENY